MNQEGRKSTTKLIETRVGTGVCEDKPRVSVVIPAFNSADFIADTLNSVLAQSFDDYEIVLVNDGSPDTETLEQILEPYFERITYISQQNNGVAAARNSGIRKSRGEFLAFLDGDDIWYPNYLEEQLTLIDKKKCDFVYSDALLFHRVNRTDEKFSERAPSDKRVTTESLIAATANVLTSGTLIKRSRVLECGMFDENLPKIGTEDFDLWFRLARSGAKIERNDKVLLKYRIRSESLSGGRMNIAERDIRVVELTEQKYDLTNSEAAAAKERKVIARAFLSLEKAKSSLSKENFQEALKHFRDANCVFNSLKLKITIAFLSISPRLVRWVFKKMRPEDFAETSAAQI